MFPHYLATPLNRPCSAISQSIKAIKVSESVSLRFAIFEYCRRPLWASSGAGGAGTVSTRYTVSRDSECAIERSLVPHHVGTWANMAVAEAARDASAGFLFKLFLVLCSELHAYFIHIMTFTFSFARTVCSPTSIYCYLPPPSCVICSHYLQATIMSRLFKSVQPCWYPQLPCFKK